MHPDGTVAVIDRSKDIIISGGEVSQLISMPRYSRLLASGQNASSLAIEQGWHPSILSVTKINSPCRTG